MPGIRSGAAALPRKKWTRSFSCRSCPFRQHASFSFLPPAARAGRGGRESISRYILLSHGGSNCDPYFTLRLCQSHLVQPTGADIPLYWRWGRQRVRPDRRPDARRRPPTPRDHTPDSARGPRVRLSNQPALRFYGSTTVSRTSRSTGPSNPRSKTPIQTAPTRNLRGSRGSVPEEGQSLPVRPKSGESKKVFRSGLRWI